MATPRTRAEFKQYCLRKLGKPVIEINVDDEVEVIAVDGNTLTVRRISDDQRGSSVTRSLI